MYSVMLAEGFTGRDLVLKVGGGWHGASPYLLKGVKFKPGAGFEGDRPAGVLEDILRRTLITGSTTATTLERVLKAKGDRIACFILEPFLGVGGFLPASREYLALARELTRRHGIVLIFDEVISGFRFAPTGVQTLYGIRPDLSVFGKIIGGGHAVAAVVGRRDIMEGCESGTGPARPRPLRRRHVLRPLRVHEGRPGHAPAPRPARRDGLSAAGRSGETLRTGVVGAFAAEGVPAVSTGAGNDAIPGSSMVMVHFPVDGARPASPEDFHDGRRFQIRLREEALKLALLVHGVNVVHGGGAVSTAHGPADLARTIEAYGEAARLFKKFLY